MKAHIICITQHDVQKLLAHTDSNREFISQTFKDFVGKKKIWSEFNSSWVTWEMLKLHRFAEYMRILANIFQEIQNCELKCLRIISYSNLWIMSHIYRSLFWGSKKSFLNPQFKMAKILEVFENVSKWSDFTTFFVSQAFHQS